MSTRVILNAFEQNFGGSLSVLRSCFDSLSGMNKPIPSNEFNKNLGNTCQSSSNSVLAQSIIGIVCMMSAVSHDGYTYIDTNDYQNKFFRKLEKNEPNIPIQRIEAEFTPNSNTTDSINNNPIHNSIIGLTKSPLSNHSSSFGDINDHLDDDEHHRNEQAVDNVSIGSDLSDEMKHFLEKHIDDDINRNKKNSSEEMKKKEINITNFDHIPDGDEDEYEDHDIVRRLTEIGVQPSLSDLKILRDKFNENTVKEDDDDDYDDDDDDDEYAENEEAGNQDKENTNSDTNPNTDIDTKISINDTKSEFKNEFSVKKNEFAVDPIDVVKEGRAKEEEKESKSSTEAAIIVSINTGENINIQNSLDLSLIPIVSDSANINPHPSPNVNDSANRNRNLTVNDSAGKSRLETETKTGSDQLKTSTIAKSPIGSRKRIKKINRIKTEAQQQEEEGQEGVFASVTEEKIASLEAALEQLQTDNNDHNQDRSKSKNKSSKKKVWIPLWEGKVDPQGPTSGVAAPSGLSSTASLTVAPVDDLEKLERTADEINHRLNKMHDNSKDMLGVLRSKASNTKCILNEMYEVIDQLLHYEQDTRMKELITRQRNEEKELHHNILRRHNEIDVHTLRHLGVNAAELAQVRRDLASRTSALYPENYTDVERYIERRRAEHLYIDNKQIDDLRVCHRIQKEKIQRCLDLPKLHIGKLYNRQMNIIKNATIKGEKAAQRAMVLLQSLRSHDTLKEEVWRAPVPPSEIGAKIPGLADPHILRDTPFSPGAFHIKQSSPTNRSLKREITALKKKESASNIGIKHLMRMRNATSAVNFEEANKVDNQINFQQECSDLKDFMSNTLKELKASPTLKNKSGTVTLSDGDNDKLLTQFEMSSNVALDHARAIVRSCVHSLVIQVNCIRWLYKVLSGSDGIEVAAQITWERFLQHDKDGHAESRKRGRNSNRGRGHARDKKWSSKSRGRPRSADARFSGSNINNSDMNGLTLSLGMTMNSPYKARESAFLNSDGDMKLKVDEIERGSPYETPIQGRSRAKSADGARISLDRSIQAKDDAEYENDFEEENDKTFNNNNENKKKNIKKKKGKRKDGVPQRPASASSAAFPPMKVKYTDHIRPPYNVGYSSNTTSSVSHNVYSSNKMRATPMLTVETHSGMPRIGASVRCRYRSRKKWVPAVIIACHDDDTYDVRYLDEDKEVSRFHGYFKQKLHGGEIECFVPRSHIRVLDKALRAGSLYPLHPSVEATQRATKWQHELLLQSPRRTEADDQVDAYISERWGSPLKITFKGLDVEIAQKDSEGEGDKSFMGLDRRKAPTPFTTLYRTLRNGTAAKAMKADLKEEAKQRPQSAPLRSRPSSSRPSGSGFQENDFNASNEDTYSFDRDHAADEGKGIKVVDRADNNDNGDEDLELYENTSKIKSRTNSSNNLNLKRLKSASSLLSNGLNESLASDEDEGYYDDNFEAVEEFGEDNEANAYDEDEYEEEDDEPTAMLRRLDAERDPISRQLNGDGTHLKKKSLTIIDDSNANTTGKKHKSRKKGKKRKLKKSRWIAVPETPSSQVNTKEQDRLGPLSRYPCVNCRRFFYGRGQELPDAVMIDRRMRHVCKEIAKDFFENQNRQKQKHETGMDTRTVGTMPTLDSFDNKLDRALRTTLVDGVPGESEATPRLLFCGGVCILDWNRRTAPLQYRHRNELLLQIMIDAKAEE